MVICITFVNQRVLCDLDHIQHLLFCRAAKRWEILSDTRNQGLFHYKRNIDTFTSPKRIPYDEGDLGSLNKAQTMDASQKLQAHIRQYTELTEDQFERVYSHFTLETYKKGQVLIRPGDQVDYEYFVVDGCLKTFFMNDDEKMFILQFAMSTWWASDYLALYSVGKSTVQVDCIVDTQVLKLYSRDRERLCNEIQAIGNFFRWRTNKGYVALQKRLLSVMNNNVQQRYEELLKQYPELYSIVPKHLIAAYLGVSRETVSRFRLS